MVTKRGSLEISLPNVVSHALLNPAKSPVFFAGSGKEPSVFCLQCYNRNNHRALMFLCVRHHPRLFKPSDWDHVPTLRLWQLWVFLKFSYVSFLSNFITTNMGDDPQLVRNCVTLNVKGLAWLVIRVYCLKFKKSWFDVLLSSTT